MARCFCGCGRRVLVKGRVANLYGGNAAKLAAEIGALAEGQQDDEPYMPPDRLPYGAAELAEIRDGLAGCATAYREVVHGERKLKEVERLDYVRYRDPALAAMAAFKGWLADSPEQQRLAALGKWLSESGLTEEQAAERLVEMDPAEIEQVLARYERRV